jgi:glucose 1-dehydrogenase
MEQSGPFSCVALGLKHEIRQLRAQGDGGSIINISSVSGFRPQPDNPAYVSAKHAVVGLTKAAALENGSNGIRINSVAPGAIDTPMLRDAIERFGFDPDEYAKQLSRSTAVTSTADAAECSEPRLRRYRMAGLGRVRGARQL